MPLVIARLRRSKAWLICKRKPALAFYMINLWTASWHDMPAASLEDDDDVLADLAMCDPSKWPNIREDVLRGWIKCDDGRLYHPVVAERAVEAWDAKLDQRWRTECARIKKHNDRHHTKLPRPTFDEWIAQGCPQGQRLHVPSGTSETESGQGGEIDSKGEGEGQREGQGQGEMDSEAKASAGAGAPPAVDKSTQTETDDEIDAKRRLWVDAGRWLTDNRLTPGDAKAFINALAKDYPAVVAAALREAIKTTAPADAKAWAVSIAQRLAGERRTPITKPSADADKTAELLRKKSEDIERLKDPEAKAASDAARREAMAKLKPEGATA